MAIHTGGSLSGDKMTHRVSLKWTFLTGLLLATLVGCGGGSDDGSENTSGSPAIPASPKPNMELLAGALGGAGNLDGAASSARFNNPTGTAVDGAGNIYVADHDNHTIRKITPTGVVTTIAGVAGQSGAVPPIPVPIASARLYHPSDVAVDNMGNIYIADTLNDAIEVLYPNGTIKHFANYDSPDTIAVDNSGNIYVAGDECTVVRITPAGQKSILAGTTGACGTVNGVGAAARFFFPRDIAVDSAGFVYVADGSRGGANEPVRKISPEGVVTTFYRSNLDYYVLRGIVTNNVGDVYVSVTTSTNGNAYGHSIQKISAGGVVTTIAGSAKAGYADGTGSGAAFVWPAGLAFDGDGNLYMADSGNHAIRKIAPNAVVTTIAGTAPQFGFVGGPAASTRFNQPGGVAIDSAGNIYVADSYNQAVRKVTAAGTSTTFAQGFGRPTGIALDSGGNVYVTDSINRTVSKISTTGVVTLLAGGSCSTCWSDGAGSAATFREPAGIVVDASGNAFVTDDKAVRKITPGGVVTTFAGAIGPSSLYSPFGYLTSIAIDGAGQIYVTDSGYNIVRKITSSGSISLLAGNSSGAWASADGTGSAALFAEPRGLAADNVGNIYVVDSNNSHDTVSRFSTIRRITSAGVVTTIIGTPGSVGTVLGATPLLGYARAIAMGVDGQLVIAAEEAILKSSGL